MPYLIRLINVLVLILFLLGCQSPDISPLEKTLWSAHPAMLKVLHDPKYYEIQIAYTQIDHNDSGVVSMHDFEFRKNDESYFYPASTVKLPLAVIALEYIDSLPLISRNTNYVIPKDSIQHSISEDVREIFAVSDNEAYNRLYEMLGRDYVNKRMKSLGISNFRLAHRLATENADQASRKVLRFLTEPDTLLIGGGIDSILAPLSLKALKKGKGYFRDSVLVNEPMDFSKKNYFPISAQHEFMKRIFFPEYFPQNEQLRLEESTRHFLKEQMHTVPRKNNFNEQDYYDSYGKFFMYGDSKEHMPETVKIYNKVGYAYGTLTDTAYIVDEANDIEFLLTATILVNENRIFNDDHYEYDAIGIPFLAQLGREIYLQERARKLE